MGETIKTVGNLAGICGHDGTIWRKALIDGTGRLVIAVGEAVQSGALIYGYYNTEWCKAPIPWGYSDAIGDRQTSVGVGAGLNSLDSSAVPADEVWYITSVYAVDSTSAITSILLTLRRDAVNYNFRRVATPAAGQSVENANPIIMKEDDIVRAHFDGCVAGDTIALTISGYKMDLDL